MTHARRLSIAAFVLGGLVLSAGSAEACRFVQSRVPYPERLAAIPVVFQGTVVAVDEDSATFRVDRPVHGIAVGALHKVPMTKDSCANRFSVGDVWLYAGSSQTEPSLFLGGRDGGPMEAPPPGTFSRE